MKAFVTGGAGFIGKKVVEKLVQRGYTVSALVHSQQSAAVVQSLGAQAAWGDINARASMVHAMAGSDIVFHMAGWYKIGDPNWQKTERVNVDGTRNVLELAFQSQVPRIIYTSTIAIYGNTHGAAPDESYLPPAGPFATEYDRTKYIAHYEVALPLIAQGAPIIIVMPGVTYGPGDNSLVGQMMVMYYRGLFPIVPGPEMTLTYAHVEDIAEGHILAAEKGRPGERYHLTGPALSLRQAIEFWARIVGREPPLFYIPGRFVKPLGPVVGMLRSVLPLPELINPETLAILDHRYIARSDKAAQELGWSTRNPYRGFKQTFQSITGKVQPLPIIITRPSRRQAAKMALGAGLGILTAWLISIRIRRGALRVRNKQRRKN